MNVHIICNRLYADRILPRLARALAQATGWTIADVPNPDAKINYFFPYLELQHKDWKDTKSAAWFTHRDTSNKDKAALWDRVASQVMLRTVTARMYLPWLEPHGKTDVVRPAVELDRFTPARKRNNRIQNVGLSGYVYNDGRKGEDLITRLIKEQEARALVWQASGRYWPVTTTGYSWQDMPKFYQHLDLFICASRIEGVPMPPLEVLACGVPVIIPIGVGMMDDLPDIHGIYRFKAGDYGDLYRVFRQAIADKPPRPDTLRAAVEQYNLTNWASDHTKAFEQFIYGEPSMIATNLPDWKPNAGMYCVAFGKPSRDCAKRLITSWLKFMPGIPVAFVGSEPLKAGETVFIKQEDKDVGGRLAKLAVDRLAPPDWKYVLYLDADAELIAPVDFMFQVLQDGWEFVICKDQDERHYLAKMRRGDNNAEVDYTEEITGSGLVMQYGGGVFGFRRNEATAKFFKGWETEYDRWLGRDQGALIRSFYLNKMRTFVLCNQFNASDRYPLPPEPIAIMHHNMQARRWNKGKPLGRLDSEAAWDEVKKFEAAQR